MSARFEPLYIANTITSYHIQNCPSVASPKPESDLDWLRRRVKEVCWVLPAKR